MYRKITDSYNDICSKGKNRRYRNDKENINHRRRRLYRKSHSTGTLNEGYEVIVYDNLCNSSKESLKRVEELSGKHITFMKEM